jgi:hypothetical protein
MSLPVRRRVVQRATIRQSNSMQLTTLTLVQRPPNTWRWFGNDGHFYSPGRNAKTTAINDAINGGILKRL